MKRLVALAVVAVVVFGTWITLRPVKMYSSRKSHGTVAGATPTPDRLAEHPDTLLEARLSEIVSRATGRCGISAKRLRTGAVARVNASTPIPLLSVVKLPVAIVVLDGVDQGRWTLSTPIMLLAGDMHPRGWLGDRYPRGGGPVSLYDLLDVMITRSDNTSADALMRLVGGPRAVTDWLEHKGIGDLRVDRS